MAAHTATRRRAAKGWDRREIGRAGIRRPRATFSLAVRNERKFSFGRIDKPIGRDDLPESENDDYRRRNVKLTRVPSCSSNRSSNVPYRYRYPVSKFAHKKRVAQLVMDASQFREAAHAAIEESKRTPGRLVFRNANISRSNRVLQYSTQPQCCLRGLSRLPPPSPTVNGPERAATMDANPAGYLPRHSPWVDALATSRLHGILPSQQFVSRHPR
jgi:hypothetical protein